LNCVGAPLVGAPSLAVEGGHKARPYDLFAL
jgi:hypothetical protein